MNSFLKKTHAETGFALPIAIGVGLIMILIGTTMVIRSNQSKISSISQNSNNKSLAAAETGGAKYMALFNQYRHIVGADLSEWEDQLTQIQSFPNCNAYSNSNPEIAQAFGSSFDPNTWLALNDGFPVDATDLANDQGGFRLTGYTVSGGQGIMTIEGADLKPDGQPSAITRLQLQFPIEQLTPPPLDPGNTGPTNCQYSPLELPINSPLESTITSGLNDEIPMTPITGDQTLPRSTDPDTEFTTYVINSLTPSIDLGTNEVLTIEDGKTVFLVTDNNIVVNQGTIRLGSQSRLFIISSGNISLNQGTASQPPVFYPLDNLENLPLQFFLTGRDADLNNPGNPKGELTINVKNAGTAPIIPVVAYAPYGSVLLNNESGILMKGLVWASRFSVTPNNTVFQSENNFLDTQTSITQNFPDFWQRRLNISQYSNRIRPISSWSKQPVTP